MKASLDHVAVCVRDLEQALRLFQETLGLALECTEILEERGVRVAFLDLGEARLELMESLGDDSEIARFLAKRGEGLHHIAFRVPDLDAVLDAMEEDGRRLAGDGPSKGARGRNVAFLHPKTAHGILIELVEAEGD